MKIAWIAWLLVWSLSWGHAAALLRFATDESLDEIQEDERHTLSAVPLETSTVTWGQEYVQLLISCAHGTLQLAQEMERTLVDTTFWCVDDKRSIGVFTTPQEAQLILSAIVYQPDANYHSSWYGLTDPLCVAGKGGYETVRMQLWPLTTDTPPTSQDACAAVDFDDLSSETGSTHEKKISVAGVNDAPTVEREPEATLSVHSGGSCIGVSGFNLGDAEAVAVESDPTALVPILRLELQVKIGKLQVNRRSALLSAIHVVGDAGKNTGGETLAWTVPDLADNSLVMKGALSDLDDFLPSIEYCSSPDPKVVAADKLRVTLSDNGFCDGGSMASLSTSLEVPVNIIPVVNIGELLFTNNKITLVTHSAQVGLQYTPGTDDEVDCSLELKYNDGMLLGIDYADTLYRKTDLLYVGASRAHMEVLIPARGLIVRFRGEKSKREETSFKLIRHTCAGDEICHIVESVSLSEGSSDEKIIAAAQMLTFANESVTDLQVIRYPVSRLWLIWNIPDTFGQEVTVSKQTQVLVQMVGRRFHLHGKSTQVATQLKTLHIYSLMGGIQSYNRLNVMVSIADAETIGGQAMLSAQLDVYSASVLENMNLVYPRELALGDNREASLKKVSLWYPSTYASSTSLKWRIRSALGSIWWEPRSVSPGIVSRQMSTHELELRGDLVDLNAALPSIRVDVSKMQEASSSFMIFYDDQTYDLFALALDSIQAWVITSDESHGTYLFQLRVQNRLTSPLDSCADASIVENAIRDLSIDKLSVSVKRKKSSFVVGRFDYTIVMSAPAGISLDLVADGLAPLSKVLFESSHVSPGNENQIVFDTILMFLERPDDSSLVASGEMSARVSRLRKKLGIRLPASYFQVHVNRTVVIEGVDFEGYADKLSFSVSCAKGAISFLPKQLSQPLLSKPLDNDSTLEISGHFSTLKTTVGHGRFVYAPKDDASGYDNLVFIIESADDKAREVLPIVIESPLKPPSLTFAEKLMSVFENEFVRIEGVTLIQKQIVQQSRISRGISINVTTLYGELGPATNHRDDTSQLTKSIQIQGDADNINAALKELRYQAPTREATEDQLVFSTHWIIESSAQVSPATFTLPIKITRRPAIVNLVINGSIVGDRSVLTTKMNTQASLGSLSLQVHDDGQGGRHYNNTAVAIAAIGSSATVELSLFAAHGLITDRPEPLLQEKYSQKNEPPLSLARFSGSMIQANMYLQRQHYVPDAKFHGPDQIVISVKYTMFEADGMTEDTVLLSVSVLPDCEAPRLSWTITGASTLDFRSSTRSPFSLPELLMTREGLEKGYCQDDAVFRVTLHSSQGFLRSKAFEVARIDDRLGLVFEGRLWDLTRALTSVEYQFDIRRDTQIPVTASIEAHVYEKEDPTTAVSSASLRLKFVGDTRPPEMLVRETVTVSEDTALMIGGMINIDAFMDLADDSIVGISVHNGAIYGASNEEQMEASSDQQVSIKLLRSVVSNLHYVPNLNFNGIDEIVFKAHGQRSPLYVYVQPVNDPPTFVLNSGDAKDWFKYPRMFLPPFQLVDPDQNDMLQVAIHVDNGSLFVDQLSTITFDGITVELSASSSSLRLSSSKDRLNTVLFQRLIEVIPTSCPSAGTQKKACAGLIEWCVDDRASSVCKELHMPEQDLFYHITMPNRAKSLNVSAGGTLNISQAFEVHQRFEVMYELIAHIHVPSGFIVLMEMPNCAELLKVIDAEEPQMGMTQRIRAPGVACLNKALTAIQLQSTYDAKNAIAIRLELFSTDMRMLANESFNVTLTENMAPNRISAVRTNSNETWLIQRGGYANLTSILAVSITADPNRSSTNQNGDDLLEVNLSCFDCQWKYREFVPSVSYEFAKIADSMVRFLGVCDALNKVLATLEIAITSNRSFGSEIFHFQLAPVQPRLVLGSSPFWKDSTDISIPFTMQSTQSNSLILPSPNFIADLRDPELAAVESTQKRFDGTASTDVKVRASSQYTKTTFALRNTSLIIHANQDEAHPIGDLLIVSGDPVDPTWFRIKARVAHGILSTPINVCCVDIHKTKHENELDVVGSALALKRALAATRFQSNPSFSGKDLLEVTIAHVQSDHNLLNVSFIVPIEIVPAKHASSNLHQQRHGENGDSSFLDEVIYDPTEYEEQFGNHSLVFDDMNSVWGQFDSETVVQLTPPQPSTPTSQDLNSITSFVGVLRPTKNIIDFEATAAVPLIHIERSIEGPLSSQYWQVITLALEVGKGWNIPGVSVGSANSWGGSKRPLLRDDTVMLEISADIGSLLLSEWDGLEMLKGREGTYTTTISVSGKMDSLNAALQTLRYQCTEGCNKQATITFQVRNPLAPPPGVSHTRLIRIDQIYDVPVPRVIAKTSLYYSSEDAAFQFPDLALQFDDNKNITRETIKYSKAEQRTQLWSAELSYRQTKYAYPRSYLDDKRHRWVADFVGNKLPRCMQKMGNTFYFAGSDEQHGEELWVSDGSSPGTGILMDVVSGQEESSPAGLVTLNGKLIFTASGVDLKNGRELWVSDGTAKNTYLVADIRQGPLSSDPQFYTLFQSKWLLFQAETDEFGVELFKTDGTAAGTVMVEDIWRGPRSSKPNYFAEWTASDGRARMYFAATSDSGRELWVSDAFSSFNTDRNRKPQGSNTPVGTLMVSDICTGEGSSNPRYLVAMGAAGLFFSATDCIHGRELWFTDGSRAGTKMVRDLHVGTNEGSNPTHLVAFNGKVYFQANADVTTGYELYVSDGSAAGTVLLVDLVPGPLSSAPALLSVVGPITIADGTTKSQGLAFTAIDSAGHENIWLSDGTTQGTTPILDNIFLLDHDLIFSSGDIDGRSQHLFEFGNAIYFTTHDYSTGKAIRRQESSTLYEIDIRVSYGTVSVLSSDSIPNQDQLLHKSGNPALKLRGTVSNLKEDLNRLIYVPPQNWNEEQFPGGHIVEWSFVVSYENKSSESFAELVVTPQVDAPVIIVPQALEDPSHYMSDYLSVLRLECLPLVVDEDTPLTLDGFSVRAADVTPRQLSTTDLLELTLSVSHGIITLGDSLCPNCISKFMGPQSLKRVSVKATVDCLIRVLKTITYVGEPNFSGADQLKIRVEYARGSDTAFDEALIPIIVVELNDAPYIDVASVFYEAEEDIPLLIEDLHLQDPDTQDNPIRVTMEASNGYLAVLRFNGVTLSTETVKGTSTEATKLTIEGTLWNVNAAIASIIYTSAKDWNSLQFRPDDARTTMNGFDTITIYSTDFSPFNESSVSVLFVYVEPAPDAVVIEIPTNDETSVYANDPPGQLRGDEDTWIDVKGLAFSSADETPRMTLTVSLSVGHGVITLWDLRGLTFLEGTNDKDSTIKFKGTFANVNACVGLRYLPNKNFHGVDSLVVSVKAVDEYTQQYTPSSSVDVAITVNPVNDAPLWSIGSSTVREIQQGQAASIRGIYFQDIDIATHNCAVDSCQMDLIVEASNGFVTMSDQIPPSFSNDVAPKRVAYLIISGTPDKLNRVLAEMTFELAGSEYYRADHPSRSDIKLQLTIDDRGTFGRGGPQVSTTTIVYSPVMWSRYDMLIVAPENVLTLDEDAIFVFNGDLQLADPDASRSFQNLLELTVTCSHGTFALSSRASGVQVLRNDSDGDIVLRGFFAQLNMALNGSSYIPSINWYGSEHMLLSVVELNHPDKSGGGAVASVFLFITSVCDEPHWSSLSRMTEPLTVKEDGYLLIDTISLTNPDLDDGQREVEVSIDVNHGGVMLSMTRGLLIQQTGYSTSEDRLNAQHAPAVYLYSESRLFFKDLVFRGRVSDVNAALEGMIFKPWLDYNSDGLPVDEISFVATSVCGSSAQSASAITIQIAIIAVNDPPVLVSQNFQPIPLAYSARDLSDVALRSSIEAVEDLPQPLELTELYDPDFDFRSNDLRVLVNISCIHCTVTSEHLSQSSEEQASDMIVVTRNWREEEGVQFIVHGNLPSLNDALMNELIFESAHNFNGNAFVLIEISDLGNYGEGGEQRAIFVLCVNVKPVNDMPQVHLPQYQSQEPVLQLDEGSSVLIQGAPALSAVSIAATRDTSIWNVMSVSLLASTRIQTLHHFSGPGALASSFLVEYKGTLLFSGRDSDLGQELWNSDGTAAGTILLKDIFPGSGDSSPSHLTLFSTDNRVYFAAKGPHLSWLLKDDYQDTCQSFRPSSFNSNVYFTVAAQNVWDPDETYDCPLGFHWMSTSEAYEVFVGTIAFEGYSEEPFTYFDQCGWHGYGWGGQMRKYFRFSDSKTTGAFKHAGFRDSYRVDTGFQTDLFAGIVCYRERPAYQVTWGTQLWATDGTATGTQRVARISTDPEGSNPSHFVELNQRLYFQASSTDFGTELWSTDGTRDGTYLVADIEFGSRSSEPQLLIAFDSRVFFSAKTHDYGRELWLSDGNRRLDFSEKHATVGTGLLFDICLGSKSSSPQHLTVLSPLTGPPLLLFQADDCIHGPELWSTDGTRAGTKLVLDIHKGATGSLPVYLTSFAGKVYFQADDGTHGAEMWTTDGSSSDTVMLVDIALGVLGSKPSFFTIFDSVNTPPGVLIFTAQAEQDRLTEFWRSDGTIAGTTKLFPDSREIVEINTDSMNLQLVGHKLVTIPSWPTSFFFLGRQSAQTADRPSATNAEGIAQTRSITLQDIESLQNKRELTVSLNCSKGWLSFGRQCDGVSLSLDDALDKKKPAIVTLKGSLNALNCAVEKVTFHSKPQENGWDEIHVTLSQVASSEENGTSNSYDDAERDSSYTISKRMLVEIRAINDPPIITMSSTFYAPLRQWVVLGEIEIDDPDADEGMLYVSISVRNGRLRATLAPSINSRGPAILHATVDGDIPQMLEFAATVEQAKVIFESLEYNCDDRFGCSNEQRDYVTVHVDDNGLTGAHGPQVATKTAEILVMP